MSTIDMIHYPFVDASRLTWRVPLSSNDVDSVNLDQEGTGHVDHRVEKRENRATLP
jgi:hypothetical protein